MSQFANMGSEPYYPHNFQSWNDPSPQSNPGGVDPNSLLFSQSQPQVQTSPSSPTTQLSLVADTYLDPGYMHHQTTYGYYAMTPQTVSTSPCASNMLHHPYPSPAPSMNHLGWASVEQDTTYRTPYNAQYRPYEIPTAGPSQHAGTVQPAAIFGKPEFRDESYPHTTLGTPETSARGTPSNEDSSFSSSSRRRPLLSSALYNIGPYIEPSLSSQSLKSTAPLDDHIFDAEADISVEENEEQEVGVAHPAAATSKKGAEKRKRTRTAQACEPCRKRKAKCSGCAPGDKCGRCTQKRIDCIFIVAPPKFSAPAITSPSGPTKRRKRQGIHHRFIHPIKPDNMQLGDAKQAYEQFVGKKNLLELQLDGPTSQLPYGYAQNPQLGFTQPMPSFEALGYTSANPGPYPTTSHYPYPSANFSADCGSMVPSMNTPSDGSYDSSPSNFEMVLTSPYEVMPFGSTPHDGYFPTTMAFPAQAFGAPM